MRRGIVVRTNTVAGPHIIMPLSVPAVVEEPSVVVIVVVVVVMGVGVSVV